MKTPSRFAKLALAVGLLAAIAVFYTMISGLSMSEPIQLPTMRTHCIGRYLIDLPEEYALTPGSDLQLYYGLDIDFETVQIRSSPLSGDRHEFDRRVRKIIADLEVDEHFNSPSKNMLAGVKELSSNFVLVNSYRDSIRTDSFVLNLYAQHGDAITRFEGKKYPDKINSKPLEYFESRLIRIAQNTHFFDAPEKAGKGSCLGTVTVDDKQDGEVFTLYFVSKKHPDVTLDIDMNSLTEKGDGGLLKRADSKADILQKLDPFSTNSTLRRGKRTMAGRPGEELLDTFKEEGKVQRYFVAETLITEPSSFTRPVIAISMGMGGEKKDGQYVDPSLSEKEGLAWWDAIVGSIRPR